MHSRVMRLVMYKYLYIYMYVNKKQAVYCLTAQKSLAECILLLSHWVKMPPVWFAKPSKLYRAIHTFLLQQHGPQALEYCMYYGMQCTALQCWKLFLLLLQNYFSFYFSFDFHSVHWQCSVHTGYVFCRTLVDDDVFDLVHAQPVHMLIVLLCLLCT